MWKTILVPHDFSAHANHAAALARDVAKSHGARLVLVHVAELPPGLDPDAMVSSAPDAAPRPAREVVASGSVAHLDDLAARLRKEQLEVDAEVVVGSPVDEIIATARRVKADLIVMGTQGRTGVAHLLVGSVAERVVRTSPVPVLTLRALEPA
jgi:nucleotide-binding universal stress UspA family protein